MTIVDDVLAKAPQLCVSDDTFGWTVRMLGDFSEEEADERAKQIELGHRALAYLAANHNEDCTVRGHCELCAIIEELRDGK